MPPKLALPAMQGSIKWTKDEIILLVQNAGSLKSAGGGSTWSDVAVAMNQEMDRRQAATGVQPPRIYHKGGIESKYARLKTTRPDLFSVVHDDNSADGDSEVEEEADGTQDMDSGDDDEDSDAADSPSEQVEVIDLISVNGNASLGGVEGEDLDVAGPPRKSFHQGEVIDLVIEEEDASLGSVAKVQESQFQSHAQAFANSLASKQHRINANNKRQRFLRSPTMENEGINDGNMASVGISGGQEKEMIEYQMHEAKEVTSDEEMEGEHDDEFLGFRIPLSPPNSQPVNSQSAGLDLGGIDDASSVLQGAQNVNNESANLNIEAIHSESTAPQANNSPDPNDNVADPFPYHPVYDTPAPVANTDFPLRITREAFPPNLVTDLDFARQGMASAVLDYNIYGATYGTPGWDAEKMEELRAAVALAFEWKMECEREGYGSDDLAFDFQ